MDTKKEEQILNSPQLIEARHIQKPESPLKKHLNLLGILRLIIGHIRNSSGEKDNMLMCVYISLVIFTCGIWWATHQEIKHIINIPNIQPTQQTPAINKRKAIVTRTSTLRPQNTNSVQINSPSPPPLPSAYYYVLFGLVVLFVIAYYARRESGRNFILKITQAATGKLELPASDLTSQISNMVGQALNKVSAPEPQIPPTTLKDSSAKEDSERH